MAHHPPLLGYNNNVRHRGQVFHIQTEDSGVNFPRIKTHLFADGGRIVKSTKTDYSEHLGKPSMRDIVKSLMKEQHKSMFVALRSGELDELIGFAEEAPPPSVTGNAVLERAAHLLEIDDSSAELARPSAPEQPSAAAVSPSAAAASPSAAVSSDVTEAPLPPPTSSEESPRPAVVPHNSALPHLPAAQPIQLTSEARAAIAAQDSTAPSGAGAPSEGARGRPRISEGAFNLNLAVPAPDASIRESHPQLEALGQSEAAGLSDAAGDSEAAAQSEAAGDSQKASNPEAAGDSQKASAAPAAGDAESASAADRVAAKPSAAQKPSQPVKDSAAASAPPSSSKARSSYAPSRPSSIFSVPPTSGGSLFGDVSAEEDTLDEAILSYLSDDTPGKKP